MVAYFAPLRRLLVFNAEKQRRREAEFLPYRACRGRFAQPRKRVAARGYARARRAVDGFACEHASALGPASAMRCIAATRHGSPLRETLNPTERCLTCGLSTNVKPLWGFPCTSVSRRNGRDDARPSRVRGKSMFCPKDQGRDAHRRVQPRTRPRRCAALPQGIIYICVYVSCDHLEFVSIKTTRAGRFRARPALLLRPTR
jgi:hypothetical protein